MSDMRTPLSKVRGLGSAKDGTGHFWHQRVSSVANVFLLSFFIILVISLQGADYATFIDTMQNPLVSVLMLLVILVGCFHMKLGMQIIIEDYVHNEAAKIFAVIGNIFFSSFIALASVVAVLKISFGA
ncbi:succinate dehydrogenase, hydrophobic membrane anchor protein [Polycladidibacter hongkongensis]|uniref:succinate dehydrogenase, hydrophobic membrane anchor protein n=1 Tax=Polycladidibacter hongkongensis TaxID=1647556 RepID=UPI00082F764F|nr:succinate dehydrogenase, hydrophobic membrane anchor protein [Pseudovibrio hongkongensis]